MICAILTFKTNRENAEPVLAFLEKRTLLCRLINIAGVSLIKDGIRCAGSYSVGSKIFKSTGKTPEKYLLKW